MVAVYPKGTLWFLADPKGTTEHPKGTVPFGIGLAITLCHVFKGKPTTYMCIQYDDGGWGMNCVMVSSADRLLAEEMQRQVKTEPATRVRAVGAVPPTVRSRPGE